MKLDSFVEQARRFEELNYDKLNKAINFLFIEERTHPWTVMRAAQLLTWLDSGEYDQVIQRKTSDRLKIRYDGDSQFCRKCGYRLEGTEKFCNSCGTALREVEP